MKSAGRYFIIICILVFASILSLEKKYNKENEASIIKNELFNNHTDHDSLDLHKNKDKLIVSLSSDYSRIDYVKLVLESLVNQSVPSSKYHIVLVLAIPEFPNKENDLPFDLVDLINEYPDLIEVLWYEKNINNHTRLIPTIKKYPNNPVLICDDNIIREKWWIKMFLEDHKLYPNDVIFGASNQYLTSEYKWESYKYLYVETEAGKLNAIQNLIVNTGIPMNGFGGTLYPVNTFTDERFFNEDLYMELSPSSDELWQWCFNIIENRTLRQSSKIYDYSNDIIKDSQSPSLYNLNNEKYNLILKNIMSEFPDFKMKLDEKFKLTNYKICLCSIVNDKYIEGFETMVYSFYKNNNWFNGDIVVLYDNKYSILSDESKEEILSKFPNVKFLKLDTSKYDNVNKKNIIPRFRPPLIKYEIFGLTDYDKVLYLDADCLVTSSIFELYNKNEDVVCIAKHINNVENKEIWNDVFDGTRKTEINNGVVFINKNILDKKHVDGMLDLTNKYNKKFPFYNGLPDQDIMQVYFLESDIKVTLVSNIYNMVKTRFKKNKRVITNEKIIHYVNSKPWKSDEPQYKYIFGIWHNYSNELNDIYDVKVKIENENKN
ncbi:nucleotide-diphospho-sugar transferase [Neocallimastix californiae]|uniref:Nucleotide-diphospho-sugar transferase n=1 Tax=Neocallimastix californiae TaxID=1754190 RepID=A0A1Y2F9H8_9FUNG|nr:nucleotide-diphospho-sugar transferase [Neocallimastix californiae]|eukprot:ORY80549.1 nucleotide-diphospho-sugar transferase [Neocallimastix californiae]